MRSLAHLKVAALGSGTAKELEQHGILADLVARRPMTPGTLGVSLAARLEPGDRVFIARARQGSPELTEQLQQRPLGRRAGRGHL